MKIKKIIAGAVASAMAVSAMAAFTSAAALMTKTGNSSSAELYDVSFEGLTDDQIKSIVKIEAKVSVTSNMVNGCIGYNKAGEGWAAENQEINEEAGPVEATWTLTVAAGDLAALDDDGNIAPFAQIQFWWVNPHYDEDGNETGDGTATLESVTLLDASGNAVVPAGSSDDNKPDDNKPDDNKPDDNNNGSASGDTNTTTPDKNNADTGVEGVAAVAGIAVLAAGAVVVAKKRK